MPRPSSRQVRLVSSSQSKQNLLRARSPPKVSGRGEASPSYDLEFKGENWVHNPSFIRSFPFHPFPHHHHPHHPPSCQVQQLKASRIRGGSLQQQMSRNVCHRLLLPHHILISLSRQHPRIILGLFRRKRLRRYTLPRRPPRRRRYPLPIRRQRHGRRNGRRNAACSFAICV